jgi:uncharacterized protein (DUF934 family)
MSKYIAYPKHSEPKISNNSWVIAKDENLAIESLPEGGVIVSFAYWKEHQASLQAKTQDQELGVFFTVNDDIVQELNFIQSAMSSWNLIAIDFLFTNSNAFMELIINYFA